MTKRLILCLVAAILIAACTKEVLSPAGKRLGEITVESDAGQIPVLISANGVWKAESPQDWISVDDAWHRGEYTVVLSYGSNRSFAGMHRPERTGFVLIATADGAELDTLVVHQKGIEP